MEKTEKWPEVSAAGSEYARLFSLVPYPVAVYACKHTECIYSNEAFSLIELFNKNDSGHNDQEERFMEAIRNTCNKSAITNVNVQSPAKQDHIQGKPVSYQFILSPIKNGEGNTTGVLACGRELSGKETSNESRNDNNNNYFRNIIEESDFPVLMVYGPEFIIGVANSVCQNIFRTSYDIIGQNASRVLTETKIPGFFLLIKEAYETGMPRYAIETPIKTTDTETSYYNFSFRAFRDNNKNITGVIVIGSNVTALVKAKKRLLLNESNLRRMIHQAPVPISVIHRDGYTIEIGNKHFFSLIGKKEHEVLGKPLLEIAPEAANQGIIEILSQVIETGKPVTLNEWLYYTVHNQKENHLNVVMEPWRNEEGRIVGIITVATDVTEQVLARQKIEYAEANARLVIESADIGTYEVNLLNNKLTTSDRFNAIWGFTKQMSRKDYAASIHPDDLEIRNKAHKHSQETGRLHYEVRILWEDGSIHWIRANGIVIFDELKTPVRLLGVVQDITREKLFAARLQQIVQERTMELQQANELLKKSNAELQQFAYVASHDLQEPLRKIQVYNDLVLEKFSVENGAKIYLNKVSNASARMMGLIRDLLNYSGIPHPGFNLEEVDLNSVAQNVLLDFELLISQKKASIKIENLSTVEASALQMNQLFFNLIGNALKFSKPDVRPALHIRENVVTPAELDQYPSLNKTKQYIKIEFLDNGIGFEQQYADKIFTIFQRLNDQTEYKGHGIGLALCRKIAENHKGLLFTASKLHEGSTFTVILPRSQ